jgi:hypothetical protein
MKYGDAPMSNPVAASFIESKLFSWCFDINPRLWVKSEFRPHFRSKKWKKFQFTQENLSMVPSGPGVYAFIVMGRKEALNDHTYIFYIGKAESGLQQRFSEYLDEKKGTKNADRAKVWGMLNFYEKNLLFSCYEAKAEDIKHMESILKDRIRPPVNTILVATKNISGEIQ